MNGSKQSNTGFVTLVSPQNANPIIALKGIEYKTLKNEYERDLQKGLDIKQPKNYFEGDDVNAIWRSTAYIIYSNWLNYYVYQVTPYDLNEKIVKKNFDIQK